VQVSYCENYYVCIVDAVENTKWKSSCHGSASVPIDNVVLQGILLDASSTASISATNSRPSPTICRSYHCVARRKSLFA